MKTVAATIGGALEASNLVLTGTSEPQTRWGLGSLASAILAYSIVPTLLVLRSAAQGEMSLQAFEAPLTGATGNDWNGTSATLIVERGAGTSKSRPCIIPTPVDTSVSGPDVLIDAMPADPTNGFDALIIGLLSNPPTPSFTLLGVLNKFEPYLDSLPPGWVVVIDQESERIWLFEDITIGDLPVVLTAVDAATPFVSFDLEVDEASETIPGYGWE